MTGGDVARPVLEPAVAHLLDPAALAAREVVMVAAAADEKGDLAVVAAQGIGIAFVRQALQVAIDGSEPDPVKLAMQLLRCHRAIGRVQRVEDRLPLLGSPAHGCKR